MIAARRTMALRGDAPAPAPQRPTRVALAAENASLRDANAGLAAALEQAPARPGRPPEG